LDIVQTPGSLEDAIGECSLKFRTNGRFSSTKELLAAVKSGDDRANSVWQRSVYLLACGIASLVNALDPEVVILGGGISNAGAALFEPLEKYLARVEWRPLGQKVEIRPAQLHERAGALGAAWNAAQNAKN
jgi:glucokinase